MHFCYLTAFKCICVFYSCAEKKNLQSNCIHNCAYESHRKKLHLDFSHFRVDLARVIYLLKRALGTLYPSLLFLPLPTWQRVCNEFS